MAYVLRFKDSEDENQYFMHFANTTTGRKAVLTSSEPDKAFRFSTIANAESYIANALSQIGTTDVIINWPIPDDEYEIIDEDDI